MRMLTAVLLGIMYLTSCAPCVDHDEPKTDVQQLDQSTEIPNDRLSFLPEGAIVHSGARNTITCFLPENTEVQGLLCRGGGHGWQTVFYANGKLALAWLAQTEEIQGVPCMAASFWTEVFGGKAMTCFHDNGSLSKCKLAKDITIEGHTFKKGDHVNFDRKGKLIVEE